jgi:tetratricopeptide (TPR) repeat protein
MASLANDLSTKLEKVGIQVIAVEWENLDASMGAPHKQEEYNEKLRECDMCMVLYWTKFGMYTKTELDTAYNEKIAGKNPQKLWVYFKEIDDPSKQPTDELKEFRDSFPTKYGHFYTPFANFDTLKAHFLLQFMEYQSQALQGKSIVEVKDGKVTIEGKEYVDLQNVPFAGNNEEYNNLQKLIKKNKKLLAITEPDDPDYAEYASELQEQQEKLAKMETSLWDTALMITQLCTSKCSERLQRAMDLFSNGDAKGAQAILNEEEIEKDIRHNLNLIKLGEEGKKGLKTNIEEYKLKVSILSTEMPEGWLKEQCELYDRIIELSEIAYGKESLETAQALTDEALPLYLLDEYKTLLEYSLKALNIRKTILGDNHLDTAQSYNDAGVAFGKMGESEKYLEYAQKGMEIREKLGADDVLLAESYNTVGCAWGEVGDYEKNLEYNLKSLDLRRKALGENHLETANAYSNVGIAYAALEQYDKYLEYSLMSYEITKKIVGDKHPDMARCYNNLADAYMCLNDYQKAIIYLQKALEVQIATTGKFSDGLIVFYENLSVAYEQSDELEKAIDNEMNAIEVSKKVWGRIHPETQKRYRRAGELLDHYGDYNLALRYLYEAFDIHLELSKEPSFEIADLCHEIGSIHFFMQDYDNAERMISNSVNILSDLDQQYACYADWLLHFGQVYEKENKYENALEQFELCLKLYKEQEDSDGINRTEAKIAELKEIMLHK